MWNIGYRIWDIGYSMWDIEYLKHIRYRIYVQKELFIGIHIDGEINIGHI